MRMKRTVSWFLGLVAGLVLAAPCAAMEILTEEWPPLTFTRMGTPDGLVMEIVAEIQARQKERTPIRVVPWARAIKTASIRPGVLLFGFVRTPERERSFTMLGPLANTANFLYARRGTPLRIRGIDDAKRVGRIAVQKGSAAEEILRRRGFTNVELSSSAEDSARKLLAGRVELWSDSHLQPPYVLRKIGRGPSEVERKLVLERQEIYLAFSRGTPATVIRRWLGTLRAMQRDGTLARIHRKWIPGATPPKSVGLAGLPPGTPMPD